MSRRNRFHRALIPAGTHPVRASRVLRGIDPKHVLEPDVVVEGLHALEEGRHADAMDVFLALDGRHPGHPLASYLAALVYHLNGEQAHAAWLFSRAMHGMPTFALCAYNFGVCLQHLGRFGDAETAYRKALTLRPDLLSAQVNLAAVLGALGQEDDSAALHEAIMRAHPTDPEARYNRSTHLLIRGDWDEGFRDYEERYRMPAHAHTHQLPTDRPIWTLEDLTGKRLLVHYEQGLGDTIMAAGYHTELCRRVGPTGEVHWHVQQPLKRLFAAQGWNVTSPGDVLPATDFTVATMSLPLRTRLVPSQFRAGGRPAYLTPKHDGPPPDVTRIGYRHVGSADHLNDRQRSTHLVQWEPLFGMSGVTWKDLAPTHGSDFYSLALDLMGLDLVITVDTAVLHLAGALGVPTWGLLATPPDWRWGRVGETTPWYRSVTLFRQPVAGDWDSVFTAAQMRLASLRQREAA